MKLLLAETMAEQILLLSQIVLGAIPTQNTAHDILAGNLYVCLNFMKLGPWP